MSEIKLTKENESLVYYGGTFEDIAWGAVQFPKLYNMRNGNIGLSVHDAGDTWEELTGDDAEKWFVSEDKGLSWRPAKRSERDIMGTILPNGDILRSQPNQPVYLDGIEFCENKIGNYLNPADDRTPKKSNNPKKLPVPITAHSDIFGRRYTVFWLDTLDDELIDKRFCFYRLKNGETTPEYMHADVDWNYRTTCVYSSSGSQSAQGAMLVNAGIYTCRDVKIAPDGSLILAHYRQDAADPFTGVYQGTTNAYFLRSVDNGESWQLQGYIPYIANEVEDNPYAHIVGGYDEPTIEFMDDGSVICLLRTCDVFGGAPEWGPTYISRSTDMCKTWSKPERFADIGALPQLVKLPNGITLAVITRPGIFIYATRDGVNWSKPLEVMTGDDRSHLGNIKPKHPNFHQWAGSCCNCTAIPIEDNRAILTFSDFYVEGEDGKKHKGIKTIHIVAE